MSLFKSVKFKLAATYSFSLLIVLTVAGFGSWAMLSYGLYHNLGESMEGDSSTARTVIMLGSYNNLDQQLAELTDSLASSVFIYDVFTKEVLGDKSWHSDIQVYLAPGDALHDNPAIYSALADSADINLAPGDTQLFVARWDGAKRDPGYAETRQVFVKFKTADGINRVQVLRPILIHTLSTTANVK